MSIPTSSRDDLAEPVVPLDGPRLREDDVGLDIRSFLVPDRRLVALEVRVLEHEQPVRASIRERPEHRMPLPNEQPTSRTQHVGDDARPAPDVGKPAQRADPGEHQVERLTTERRDGVVQVGFDEVRVRRNSRG